MAADTARFQGDLGRAAAIAEARMRNIKDTSARALGAVTVAATAAGAALVVALKAAVDRADGLDDLSQRLGVTVENLSRLQYAAKFSGLETEQLNKALAKLAADGARDSYQELLTLAEQFSRMPDGAAKTALAIDKFGEKLGPYLVPLLNEGREGLERFAAESDRTGNTIRTNTAQAAAQLNDRLDELNLALTGMANTLLAELAPGLSAYAGLLASDANGTDGLTSSTSALATILRGLIEIIDRGAVTFVSFATTLGAAGAAAAAAARGDFSAAAEIIRERNREAAEETRRLEERLKALYDTQRRAPKEPLPTPLGGGGPSNRRFFDFGDKVKDRTVADQAREAAAAARIEEEAVRDRAAAYEETFRVRREWYALGDEVQAAADQTFAEFVNSTAGDIASESARQLDIASAAVKGTFDELSVYATRAAENMQDAFANFLFDPFKGGVRGMLSEFVNVLRRMAAEAAAAKIFDSLKGSSVGGFLSGVGKLFGFATGGSFTVGGSGGTDSQLVAFRATPGERVDVRTPGQQRGGGSVVYAPVTNIDARGADAAVEQRLRAYVDESNRAIFTQFQRALPGLRV